MNKKKKSIRYQWHPTLLNICGNFHFQWLLAQANLLVCKLPSFYSEPVLYHLAAGDDSLEDEEVRLVTYPLLQVSLWPSQSAPPKEVLFIKKHLSDEELERVIISELLRRICFSPEPDECFCECVRLLINSTISSSSRMTYFGEKRLSQTFFGQTIGLTREQMARGAAKIREQKKKQQTSSFMDINFFNEVFS